MYLFTQVEPFGTVRFNLFPWNRAYLNQGLVNVRVSTSLSIVDEKTESNRLCCFHLSDAVFQRIPSRSFKIFTNVTILSSEFSRVTGKHKKLCYMMNISLAWSRTIFLHGPDSVNSLCPIDLFSVWRPIDLFSVWKIPAFP